MADQRPRPATSPRPDIPPDIGTEPGTDPGIRLIRQNMHSELNWQGAKLTIATAVIAVGTAFGAFTFIHNDARAQTDAGLTVMRAEQKAVDVRVTTMEKRLDRVDEKLDLLLDAARVPAWKRPPPLDGGQQ